MNPSEQSLTKVRAWIGAFFFASVAVVFSTRGHCADLTNRIQQGFPGYVFFQNEDFEKYVLEHSTSPAVAFGRFRGRDQEFAALIRTQKKKQYKNTSLSAYEARLIVCTVDGSSNCSIVLSFQAIVPYQSRVIAVPEKDSTACESGSETFKVKGESVGLWNDDKTGFAQFAFHKARFVSCASGE